jgi:acetyltransferase EpsM
MKPLLILGTGPFATQLAALVCEIPGFEATGFVESNERRLSGTLLEGLPVHWVDEISHLAATHQTIAALGTTHRSRFVAHVARLGFEFATLVHPRAWVGPKVAVGEGTLILPGANIAPYAAIGRHVLINRGVLIGHHTAIGDFVTLSPGANVAGNCRVGDAAYLALGAIVLNDLTIGAHAVVGAGAVVTRPVPDGVQVLGVPARVVREQIGGL